MTRTYARNPGHRAAPVLALTLVLAGCSGGSDADAPSEPSRGDSSVSPEASPESPPEPPPDPTDDPTSVPKSEPPEPSPEPVTADPEILRVSPSQWQAIVQADMVRPECPVQRRGQLRVVEINHVDFSDRVRRGRLVVNADVAASSARIFSRLFEAGFPIRRMRPLEGYGGDNQASLVADNTAAFNCRSAEQINAPFTESPHANGRAIDINPRENPWQDRRCGYCWQPTARFAERSPGPGKILRGGVVWRAFVREGWIWQNISVEDYMHFDTGYPSGPYSGPG